MSDEKKDSLADIIEYYSQNTEELRHERHQLEFAMMREVFKLYLSSRPMKILELGAGSGLYTAVLAQMGHDVVALEPTQLLIKLNEKRIKDKKLEERVQWVHADARDLGSVVKANQDSEKFDIVLNMGPFYHLEKESDRHQVFQESVQLLKPEGLHFGIFLSKVGYASYVLNQQPDILIQDPDGFREIMTQGFYSSHPRNGTFRGYFSDLQDMQEIHNRCEMPIQKLHILDPAIAGEDKIFNSLSDELKAIWSQVLFALSTDPSFWGSGRTWLAISQNRSKDK